MSINYKSPPNIFVKQLIAAISARDNAELLALQNFANQGKSKWLGTLKKRDSNLKKAINFSTQYLTSNKIKINDENIIKNLWRSNDSENEFKWVIQEIANGRTKDDSFVYWIDGRGIERKNSFSSIHKMIKKINESDVPQLELKTRNSAISL